VEVVAFGIAIAHDDQLGRVHMLAYSISLAHESREVCHETITGIHSAFYRQLSCGVPDGAKQRRPEQELTPTSTPLYVKEASHVSLSSKVPYGHPHRTTHLVTFSVLQLPYHFITI
jgi:hypothetical protein